MYVLYHFGVAADVLVVPQRGRGKRGIVGAGVDRTILRAHHPPATLRLGFAHGRHGVGVVKAHPSAMGDLIKAIGCGDRPDRDGFKEDVVAGIASH